MSRHVVLWCIRWALALAPLVSVKLAAADMCHPIAAGAATQERFAERDADLGATGASKRARLPVALALQLSYDAFDRGAVGQVTTLQVAASYERRWLRVAAAGAYALVSSRGRLKEGWADPVVSLAVRPWQRRGATSAAVWAGVAAMTAIRDDQDPAISDGHAMLMPTLTASAARDTWFGEVSGMYHVMLGSAGHHHHSMVPANVVRPMIGEGLAVGLRVGRTLAPQTALDAALSVQRPNDEAMPMIYQAQFGVMGRLARGITWQAALRLTSIAGSVEPGILIGASAW